MCQCKPPGIRRPDNRGGDGERCVGTCRGRGKTERTRCVCSALLGGPSTPIACGAGTIEDPLCGWIQN